jgi:thiaminase
MQQRDRQKEIERIIKIREWIIKSNGINKTEYAKKLGYKNLQAYESVEKNGANIHYLFHLYHSFGIPANTIISADDPPLDLKE